MLLNVAEVKPTKSGKSVVVKAGGKDYFAKTDQGITAGITIEAETKDSDYNGKTLVWIEKWHPVTQPAPAPAQSSNSANCLSAPWLPFASNTVAHAIQAGIITAPNQIEAWTRAAKEAFYKVATTI